MLMFSIHHSNTPPLSSHNIMNINIQLSFWNQLNSMATLEQPHDWLKKAGSLIRNIQFLNVKPKKLREVKLQKSLQTQVSTEEEDKFNFFFIRVNLNSMPFKRRWQKTEIILCDVRDWWVNLLSNLLI